MSIQKKSYDILICGGGIVGMTLASALANSSITRHLKVGLIEAGKIPLVENLVDRNKPGIRVSAISPKSASIFNEIGALNQMNELKVHAYNSMKVYESCGTGFIEWFGDEEERRKQAIGNNIDIDNENILGYVMENDVIVASLFKQYNDHCNKSNFDVYNGMKCEKIENILIPNENDNENIFDRDLFVDNNNNNNCNDDLVHVNLSDGTQLKTKLLVGADGPRSLVKQSAELGSFGWSYNQKGVVATVKLEESTNTAWQRFFSNGPLALLPLYNNMGSIVWSTTNDHAHYLQSQLTATQFKELLNEEFSKASVSSYPLPNELLETLPFLIKHKLPKYPPKIINIVEMPKSFPLRFSHTLSYIRHRVALIGDTCHTVHPMAGQGANIGISDAYILSKTIESAIKNGQDFGHYSTLTEYEGQSKISNVGMMFGVDALQRIFGLQSGPLKQLRSAGLDLVNATPFIKNLFSKVAKGEKLF